MKTPDAQTSPVTEPTRDAQPAGQKTAVTAPNAPSIVPGPARNSAHAPQLANSRDDTTSKR
jgi:hypothetical protein